MAINKHDDYEKLAKLLYPSIEASGNVYYGQTRKLTMDSFLGKNELSFDSHIESFKNGDSEYASYFCWKLGSLRGSVKVNSIFQVINFNTFPDISEYTKINADGSSEAVSKSSNYDVISGNIFAEYDLISSSESVDNITNAGNFTSYEVNWSAKYVGICVTDKISPVDFAAVENIEDRSFFIDLNSKKIYVHIAYNTAKSKLPNYLCFTAEEPNSTIKLLNYRTSTDNKYKLDAACQVSNDGLIWRNYDTPDRGDSDIITLSGVGSKIYFRCLRGALHVDAGEDEELYGHLLFVMTGKIAASGNVNSLLNPDNFEYITDLSEYGTDIFYDLFNNCTSLTKAPELPAKYISDRCYMNMFHGCTALVNPPELPATTLADECYSNMFSGCTSLIKAPALNVNKFEAKDKSCYGGMFSNCSALTDAPDLPSTVLSESCYASMFSGCTSLTKAPSLPAISLSLYCYEHMFEGCSSLAVPPKLPATDLTHSCYAYMFNNCKSLSVAPLLPALTLNRNCYNHMFSGCTSLVKAPNLPATSTIKDCYKHMFDGCSNLNEVHCNLLSPSNIDRDMWLNGVSPTGKFYYNTGASAWPISISGIPVNWLAIDSYDSNWLCFTAEEPNSTIKLVKTSASQTTSYKYSTDGISWLDYSVSTSSDTAAVITLQNKNDKVYFRGSRSIQSTSNYIYFIMTGKIAASGNVNSLLNDSDFNSITRVDEFSFNYLFKECTSLTSMPDLPADHVGTRCYEYMFSECTSLNRVTNLPATVLSLYCYADMFFGCTSLTEAPELPATELATYCYAQMFAHCKSLTKAPNLPATNLAAFCYQAMFAGCSNLSEVHCNAVQFAGVPTTNWLSGVSPTGKFFYNKENTNWSDGTSGIPTGWSKNTIVEPEKIVTFNAKDSEILKANDVYDKQKFLVVSGSDSNDNGRGKLNKDTLFNMHKENPFNSGIVKPDTHNENSGSYNQEVWGYKCFNSPVSFRNGIYGECSNITTMSRPSTVYYNNDEIQISEFSGSEFNCYNGRTNSVLCMSNYTLDSEDPVEVSMSCIASSDDNISKDEIVSCYDVINNNITNVAYIKTVSSKFEDSSGSHYDNKTILGANADADKSASVVVSASMFDDGAYNVSSEIDLSADVINVDSDLVPSGNNKTIGNQNHFWFQLYSDAVYANRIIGVNSSTIQTIEPVESDSDSYIGAQFNPFLRGRIDNLYTAKILPKYIVSDTKQQIKVGGYLIPDTNETSNLKYSLGNSDNPWDIYSQHIFLSYADNVYPTIQFVDNNNNKCQISYADNELTISKATVHINSNLHIGSGISTNQGSITALSFKGVLPSCTYNEDSSGANDAVSVDIGCIFLAKCNKGGIINPGLDITADDNYMIRVADITISTNYQHTCLIRDLQGCRFKALSYRQDDVNHPLLLMRTK